MTTTTTSLTSDMTVNDAVRLFPATLPIFNAAGIDTCCGGKFEIREVARRHSLDLEELMARLWQAIQEGI